MTTHETALKNAIFNNYKNDGLEKSEALKVFAKEYGMLFRCYESMTREEALKIIFDNNFCTF